MECTGDPEQVTDESCSFTCDYGFELEGTSLRTCLSNHEWTGLQPNCIVKHCHQLTAPPNSYIATKPCNTQYTSECNIQCVDGFYMNTDHPYHQVCTVEEIVNKVYWTDPPTCELMPPCMSNPCLNNGLCININEVDYQCQCSQQYKGRVCEIGIVETPSFPILVTNQSSDNFTILAYPQNELIVEIITSSSHLNASPSVVTFSKFENERYFTLSAFKDSIYTIFYNLKGSDSHTFQAPSPARVIAVTNDSFDELFYNDEVLLLTTGCYTSDELFYQCPNSLNTINLTSTCSWSTTFDEGYVTNGVVFAISDGLTLPISIAGINFPNNNITNGRFPMMEYTCDSCNSSINDTCRELNKSCTSLNFSARDIVHLLTKQFLHTSFFNYIKGLLPEWLSIVVRSLNKSFTSETIFSAEDYAVFFASGQYLDVDNCQHLTLNPNGLYYLLRYNSKFHANINGVLDYQPCDNETLCIAVNTCDGNDSSIHMSLPPSFVEIINQFKDLEDLIDNGWEFNFNELIIARDKIDIEIKNDSLNSYWTGSSFINNSIWPSSSFNTCFKLDFFHDFGEDNNSFRGMVDFTGYLYYDSYHKTRVLDGIFTMTLHLPISNETSSIHLTNEHDFIIVSNTFTNSYIGVYMNLNYTPATDDVFFSQMLPCKKFNCPSSVFINMTNDMKINYISIHTNTPEMTVHGITFPSDAFEHVLLLSNNSNQILKITSNLIMDSLILNPFMLLKQPLNVSAIQFDYWDDGQFTVVLPSVLFSLLGTTFITPVKIDNNGLFFKANASIFELYDAQIFGSSLSPQKLSLNIYGVFLQEPYSFMNELEIYIYKYINTTVSKAKERLNITQSEIDYLQSLLLNQNERLSELKYSINNLSSKLQEITEKVDIYAAILNESTFHVNSSIEAALQNVSSVCQYVSCNDTCVPVVELKIQDYQMNFKSWIIDSRNSLRQVLTQQKQMISEMKPFIKNTCRLTTNIRGWGETSFGQVCSFKTIISNITYETQVTSYVSANVSTTQLILNDEFPYNLTQVLNHEETACSMQSMDIVCAALNIACQVVQGMTFDSLTETEKQLFQFIDQQYQAESNLSVAKFELNSIKMKLSNEMLMYNQSVEFTNNIQNQLVVSQQNLQRLSDELSSLLLVGDYMKMYPLDELLKIINITFSTIVTDSSQSTMPVTVFCKVPSLNMSFNVNKTIDFSLNSQIIKRYIAMNTLSELGNQLMKNNSLNQQTSSNPPNLASIFDNKCPSIDIVKNTINQLNNSLKTLSSISNNFKSNITSVVNQMNDMLSSVKSVNFSSMINFTFLYQRFNNVPNQHSLHSLLNSSMNDSFLNILILKLNEQTDLYQLLFNRDSFLTWHVANMGLFTVDAVNQIANVPCFGFMDCLYVIEDILEELITDNPMIVDQNISLASLSMAKKKLNLNETDGFAETLDLMYEAIVSIEDSPYWCAEVPVIIEHPTNITVIEIGTQITLSCEAESILPITYTWAKNGFIIPQLSSNDLVINNTMHFDKGQYQCRASNAIGTVHSLIANVIVYTPLVMVLQPSNYTTFEGSDNGGWFACNATSYSLPTYVWYYSNDLLNWSLIKHDGSNELIVTKPTINQEGWYRCEAYAGDDNVSSESAYLTVYGASISTIYYPVEFQMIVLEASPVVTDDYTQQLKKIINQNFFSYISNEIIYAQDLDLMFDNNNATVLVKFSLSYSYNYSLTKPISDQAVEALHDQLILNNTLTEFTKELQRRTLFFHYEESLYASIGLSIKNGNMWYKCPTGQGLKNANFLCIDCPKGMHSYMETCVPCPKGTYNSKRSQEQCQTCPDDTSTLESGSMSDNECIVKCPSGSYSSTGLIPCTSCPSNYYNLYNGSTQCEPCDYTLAENITNCNIIKNTTTSISINITSSSLPTISSSTVEPVGIPVIIGVLTATIIIFTIISIFICGITILLLKTRKKKLKTSKRETRKPSIEMTIPNTLFGDEPDDKNQMYKVNPLYGTRQNPKKENDNTSIASYEQVGQFFPQHNLVNVDDESQADVNALAFNPYLMDDDFDEVFNEEMYDAGIYDTINPSH
jgi:hypothetical protein